MDRQLVRFSKFLSPVLRHQSDKYGLSLDPNGWAKIDDLIAVANRAGVSLRGGTQAFDGYRAQRFDSRAGKNEPR